MKDLLENELKHGITQRALASAMHVSHGTVQNILNTDTKCTYETREKVAKFFGIPVSQFYDDDEKSDFNERIARIIPTSDASPDADEWKDKYIARTEELIEAGKKIIDLKERITNLEKKCADFEDKVSGLQKQIDRLTAAPIGADLKAV